MAKDNGKPEKREAPVPSSSKRTVYSPGYEPVKSTSDSNPPRGGTGESPKRDKE